MRINKLDIENIFFELSEEYNVSISETNYRINKNNIPNFYDKTNITDIEHRYVPGYIVKVSNEIVRNDYQSLSNYYTLLSKCIIYLSDYKYDNITDVNIDMFYILDNCYKSIEFNYDESEISFFKLNLKLNPNKLIELLNLGGHIKELKIVDNSIIIEFSKGISDYVIETRIRSCARRISREYKNLKFDIDYKTYTKYNKEHRCNIISGFKINLYGYKS